METAFVAGKSIGNPVMSPTWQWREAGNKNQWKNRKGREGGLILNLLVPKHKNNNAWNRILSSLTNAVHLVQVTDRKNTQDLAQLLEISLLMIKTNAPHLLTQLNCCWQNGHNSAAATSIHSPPQKKKGNKGTFPSCDHPKKECHPTLFPGALFFPFTWRQKERWKSPEKRLNFNCLNLTFTSVTIPHFIKTINFIFRFFPLDLIISLT